MTLSALALCCGLNVVSAQETISPKSVTPKAGVVSEVGTVELNFAEVPAPNTDCGELAVMKKGDEVISSISTEEANRLQQGAEGQADTAILFVFSKTKITDSGTYTVIVPEGFLKFGDASTVNAEYSVEYTVSSDATYIVEPTPGYFTEGAPTDVKVTFPGVKEIIDNHQQYDVNTGAGGVRFHTVTEMLTDFVIEGNTLSFHVSDVPLTSPGEYLLVMWQGALTFVYEDGSRKDNAYIEASYIKPVIPFPSLDFVRENSDVYEIGTFTMSLEGEGAEFTRFMRPPSLYSVTESGKKNVRLASWNPSGYGAAGKNSYELVPQGGDSFKTPGNYLFIIGKSSFEAKGPYYDPDYYGELDSSSGGDDLSGMDPFEGKKKGDIIKAWNSCEYIYRIRITKSPASPESDLPATVKGVSMFNLYFPKATKLELNPECTVAPSIRDQYWREQKGHTVNVEIVKGENEPGIEPLEKGAGCSAIVTVSPEFTKKGEYDITFPKDMFICEGDIKSPDVNIHVTIDPTISGVAGPEAEEDAVNVYTPAGVQVISNGRMSDLMDLPAGLYIINGRATILR